MSSSMAPVEIVVVSRKTAVTKYGMPTDFRLEDGGVVQIQATRAQVKDLARVGKDLVVTLQNGETITVRDFFAPLDGGQSHVVLQDDAEGLWLVELGTGEGSLSWGYSSLYSIDSLMASEQTNSSIPIVAMWGGMAGLLAVGSASTHNASQKPSPAVLEPVNGVKPITGTAEPGATVIVSFPGGGSHTAVVGADGKFSVPNPGLKDGDTVTVVVSHHGAESNPVVITVDALAPANPVVHPVNATHPITGTAEPGSTVTVTFPDGSQKTTVAGKDGHFEVPNPGMLADGQPVKVTATDPAGNVSGEVIMKVDAVAPPVPQVHPVNGHDPITGTAEPGAVVTMVWDNGKTITGVADADGHFSLPNPGTMKDGEVIRVSATDAAGNTGPSATVTIDASAPVAPKLNPVNGKDPITGEAEPHSTIKVTLPDGTTAVAEAGADGKFQIPNPGLEDGASLQVVSVDAAGNASEPVIVVVDARAPAPPQVDTVSSKDPITGHAEPGSTVTVTYPDGSTSTTKVGDAGSFSIPNPGGLEGGQILIVVATDAAGNTSDPTRVPVHPEDPVPVLAPIVNPANALDPVTGTAVPGSKVTVTLPDHSQVEGHADEHGHFSVAHPDMVLKDGDVIVVQVSDVDGNTSDPVRVTIDAVAPTTPTIDPVNALNPISGTAEPGSKVTITFPDGQSQTVVAGPDGHFSMANPGLEDGKAITVTATDAAGNVSGEATITVDGIAPVLTITDDVDGIVGKDGHVTFTFTFSEDVKDFDLSDIQVSGGQAGQLVQISPRVYMLEVKPPAGGTLGIIQVSVAAGAVHDAAGNANLGVTAQQAYDLVAPGLDSLSQLELQDDVGDVRGEIKTGMTTDDSTPTYVGKADPAEVARVELLDKGVVIGSAVVNADGSFSVSPDHPITGGGHSFSLRPVDAAGNVGPATPPIDFIFDGVKPGTPAIGDLSDNSNGQWVNIQKGDSTKDTTPVISGTGTAGNTITVYDGAAVVGTTVVDKNGHWSVEVTELDDGEHKLHATATNPAGVESDPTGEYIFIVDTVAPDKPAMPVAYDNVGADQGPIQPGGTTDDATPTLAGKVEPGERVTIYDNGKVIGQADVDKDGYWNWTPATDLAEGPHSLTSTVTDKAGNESQPSDAISFTVDTTPLELVISRVLDNVGDKQDPIASGGATDDATPTFEGRATAGATVTILEGGKVIATTRADAQGHWSVELPHQADGTHVYEAQAKNAAGDIVKAGFTLTVDTQPSSVPTVDGAYDDVGAHQGSLVSGQVTDDTTPTLKGTGTAGDRINVYDGDTLIGTTTVKSDGTWEYTVPALTTDGEHRITATSVDAVGNESARSDAFIVNLDTSVPDLANALISIDPIAGDNRVNAVEAAGNAILTGKLTGVPSDVVEIKVIVELNGTKYVANVINGHWSVSVSGDALVKDSDHKLKVTATFSDAAGNSDDKSVEQSYTVDLVGPGENAISELKLQDDVGDVCGEIKSGMTTDDSTPTYIGKADPDEVARVELLDKGVVIGSAVVNADGSFSVSPDHPITGSDHSFSLRPVDAAGNVGPATPVIDFTFDGVKPGIPAITDVSHNEGGPLVNIQKGGSTKDTTPVVSGTGTAGSTIKVYDGSTVVGTATVDAKGHWSVELNALSEGEHRLTATATNAAGVESEATGPYPLIVDTVPPAKPLMPTASDNVGADQGPIKPGSTTDDATPTLTGKVEPGERVTIYDNGRAIGEVDVDKDGYWSWTPSTDLAEGSHSLTSTVTDKAGNESQPSDAITFTVDTTPLELVINRVLDNVGSKQGPIASGGATDDATPTFEGRATAGATVTILEGGKVIATTKADAQGHWSVELPHQSDGTHVYEAQAKNAAGDIVKAGFTLTVDTQPSSVPTVGGAYDDVGAHQGPLVSGQVTDDTTPTLKGTGMAGDRINVYDGDTLIGTTTVKSDGTWEYTVPALTTDGEHRITTTSVDAVGNESARSDAFIVNLDTTPPDLSKAVLSVGGVTGDNIVNASESQGTVTLTGTLTGLPKTEAVTVKIVVNLNGTIYEATLVGEAWTLEVPGQALVADIDHKLQVVATVVDEAGNASQLTVEHAYSVDNTLTQIWLNDKIAGDNIVNADEVTSVIVGGTTTNVSDGRVVTVTFSDGVHSVKVTGTVSGNAWTAGSANLSGLNQGAITVTAEVVDQLGNARTAESIVKLDTIRPANPDDYQIEILLFEDNVAPNVNDYPSGTTTNDTSPLLKGTVAGLEVGDVVRIYEGSRLLGTANVLSDGSWTFQLAGVTEGEHGYTAVIYDAAGNAGLESRPFTLTVDFTPPAFAPTIVSYTDDQGSLQGDFGHATVTDDTAPVLNGTVPQALAAGEEIRVYKLVGADSVLVGIATVSADGKSWALQLSGLQHASDYEFVAKVVDAAGNSGPLSNTFKLSVDTHGPSIATSIDSYADDVGPVQGSTFSSGTTTDDRDPVLKGSLGSALNSGDTVQVYQNGVLLGNAQVLGGNWTFQLHGLANGTYEFTAIVVDRAGNLSDKGFSGAFTIHVSGDGPTNTVQITSFIDDVGAYQGAYASGSVTDDASPVLQGTLASKLASGETVRIYQGGTYLGNATVNADGLAWTFQLSGLVDGKTYSYTATVATAAGVEGAPSEAFTLTLDTTPPQFVPTITSYWDDVGSMQGNFGNATRTDDTSPTLVGTLPQALAVGELVRVYQVVGSVSTFIGNATVNGLGWTYELSGLANDTSYTYVVRVVDAVGNEGGLSNQFTLTVDTAGPSIGASIKSYVDDVGDRQGEFTDGWTDDTTPRLKGTLTSSLNSGDIVQIYQDGKFIGLAKVSAAEWYFDIAMPLNDGVHVFQAVVSDAAGNLSSAGYSSEFTIRVDTTAPESAAAIVSFADDTGAIKGHFPSGSVTDDTAPQLVGSLSAPLAKGETVRIYQGSTLLGEAMVSGTNWTFDVSGLQNGQTYSFTAVVTSITGAEGDKSAAFRLTVDTTAPSTTTTIAYFDHVGAVQGTFGSGTTTDDRTPQLKGVLSAPLDAGDRVAIYESGKLLGYAMVSGTGWIFNLPDALKDASSHTYVAKVMDLAGNEGTPASLGLTVALTLAVKELTTSDTTPIVSGSVGFELLPGEYLQVTINGVSYSSKNGAVVVDSKNGTWYLQIPDTNPLGYSTYDMAAQVLSDSGSVTQVAHGSLLVQPSPSALANTDWATTANPGNATNNTMVIGLNSSGLWTIMADTQVYSSTNLSSYAKVATLTTNHGDAVSWTAADFARNGLASIAGTDTYYGNATQSFWTNTGSGYTLSQQSTYTTVWYGGVIAYDKTGDGYLDLAYGDGGGPDSITLLVNNQGKLSPDGGNGWAGLAGFSTGRELSGVDINNNGTVDIAYHTTQGGSYYSLTILDSNGTGTLSASQYITNVFNNQTAASATNSNSMTWADFDGNGYMDLYLASTNGTSGGAIYYNNGDGTLSSDKSAVGSSTAAIGFISAAVDWNHDGMMDIVKFTQYGGSQTATLFTNVGKGAGWTSSVLAANLVNVTGMAAMDYNWDGAVDMIISQQNGKMVYVQNNQSVAAGTAMHLRIVDSEGINVYYGNTVQLYNASGKLVASQIINAQSGIGTNDSSALVNFYGLNSHETYSAKLIKVTNGISSNVTWDGLVAGNGKTAYDLTADAATGGHSGILTGTGYNDTFIATAGTYTYNGGGGWSGAMGHDAWSKTGGQDIVDFRHATVGVNVNLNITTAQNTGFNTVTLGNIEGVTGSAFADIITGDSGDNVLEGRGGNDIFHMASGGHDTLMYKLLVASDATGGNGQDMVNGFTVGVFETMADADRIDLGDLLQGYAPTVGGQYAAQYINGVATIAQGDRIANYLKVEVSGDNTLVEIDRSGSGASYTTLLTLNGVHTDLATLLANHQITLV